MERRDWARFLQRREIRFGMTNRTFKTGVSRDQPSLLPPRVEDYVAGNNPVRVIEAFVAALDLGKLGFRDVGSSGGGWATALRPSRPAEALSLWLPQPDPFV